MRTGNPALKDGTFAEARSGMLMGAPAMTIDGTINKTGLLLLLLTAAAAFSWNVSMGVGETRGLTPMGGLLLMGGTIGGLVFAMITIFKQSAAPITAPVYAILEGLVLGAISVTFEQRYPGIVFQALLGTFGTLFAMLAAYKSKMIEATPGFRTGVIAATGGIALAYFLTMIFGFFGIHIPYIHDGGPIGVAFSAVVVIVAALNLILDFDVIVRSQRAGAPKFMEWYGGFTLMVTLVWLYMAILRLLGQSRR